MEHCLECGQSLHGRLGKKFCNPQCKSAYHYRHGKEKQRHSVYTKVNNVLRNNRRILAQYNKARLATVDKHVMLAEGFRPRYFTHFWRNRKNEVYMFCYEYGFRQIDKNGKHKYVLVQWQDYMEEA